MRIYSISQYQQNRKMIKQSNFGSALDKAANIKQKLAEATNGSFDINPTEYIQNYEDFILFMKELTLSIQETIVKKEKAIVDKNRNLLEEAAKKALGLSKIWGKVESLGNISNTNGWLQMALRKHPDNKDFDMTHSTLNKMHGFFAMGIFYDLKNKSPESLEMFFNSYFNRKRL